MPPAGPLTRADGNAPRAGAHPRVRHWLNKAGLAHYWDRLSSLTEPEFGALGMVDYAALGIVDSADKQKLFRLIKNLNAEGAFKTDATVDATPAHPAAPAPPARRGVGAEVVHDPGPADDAKKPKSPIGSSDAMIGEGEGAGDLRVGDPSSPLEEDPLPPVVDPRVTAFDLDHARRASSSGGGGSDPIRNDRHVAAFESAGSRSPPDDALLTEAAGLGADLMENNQTDGNHRGDLMDVDDGEEEEFLLSPVAARRGLSATFAPSPTRVGSGGGGDDRDDGGSRRERARARRGGSSSPLDQLHELSLERAAARRADPSTADAARGGHDDDAAPGEVRHHHPPPLAPPPADQPRIRVVVRKRPLNKKERASDQEDVVTVDRGPPVVAPMDRSTDGESERSGAVENAYYARASASLTVWEPKTKVDLTKYTESHVFAFDDVFPEDASNDEVYRTTVKPLLGSIFDKCKVTCFAYGQTGSGKTYTMSPLPTRAAGEILGELARRDDDDTRGGSRGGPGAQSLSLHVSFFEIYGGKVYDLLNGRRKLVIREDARNQMCVVGLQEFEVDTVDLVERLIEHGTAARCVGSTGANAESSRSHAIMQFALKAKQSEDDHRANKNSATNGSSALGGGGPNGGRNLHVPASVLAQRREKAAGGANCHAIVHGKFSFIDLAGSERGADTSENDRQTRIEGAEINKSLLALKECIRALDRGSGHVPFRGSKLTEVLRDSFMGDSRTVMIANVSPATGSCEHTLNTLRYAYRVKELRSEGGEREGGRATNAGGGSHRDATETLGERALEAARAEKEAAAQREAGAKKGGGTLGRARPQTARPRLQAAAEAPEKAREPTTSNSARDARRAAAQRVAVRRSAEDAGGGGLTSPRKRGFRDAEKDRAQAAAISQTRRGEKKADAREAKADAAFGSKADAGGLVKDPRWAARADPHPSRPKSALPRASSSSAEASSLGGGAEKTLARASSVGSAGPPAHPASSRAAAANPAAGTDGPPRTPERASAKAARALLGAEAGDDRDDEKAPPSFSEGAFAPVSAAVDPAVPPAGASPPHPLPSSSSFARALAAATGSGPPVPASEMAAAHDDLINVILEEEEEVVSAHRAQIEKAMELVKKEMGLLAEVDKPGSAIDVYVERLAEVLERKAASIAELAAKVKTFRAHLRQEETLSKAVGLH